MINESHDKCYFDNYIKKIDEIIKITDIIPWELYEVKTPYDLTINGLNFEVKLQFCDLDVLALEQYTDHHNKIRGWTHHLKDNFVDIVLFYYPMYNKCIAIFAPDIQDWWEVKCNNYPIYLNDKTKNNNGRVWTSSFSYVKIVSIPKKMIWYTNLNRKEKGLEHYIGAEKNDL